MNCLSNVLNFGLGPFKSQKMDLCLHLWAPQKAKIDFTVEGKDVVISLRLKLCEFRTYFMHLFFINPL